MLNKNLKITAPLITAVLFYTQQGLCQDLLKENVDIKSSEAQIESLMQEKKINRSLFLPELDLKIGVGSEKLKDFDYETDKGPFSYLDGRLNLYRGGKDSLEFEKIDSKISSARLEKEIKLRELQIELRKKLGNIKLLDEKNALIQAELNDNKIQESMARKKVNAGLTTSVDLLDFELKFKMLSNEMEKNNLEKELIAREFANLSGSKSSVESYKINNAPLELLPLSIESSPKLQLAKNNFEQGQIEKKAANKEYLPSVDLEAKWGQLTPQTTFWKEEKEHQIALSVTIPLFSGFSTQGKVQQSIIEASQKERELRQAQINLESELEFGKKKIELLRRTLSILESSLAQTQKYKELTIAEYKRGIKNSPDVISASDKNFEQKLKLLETRVELDNAIFAINETFKTYQDK